MAIRYLDELGGYTLLRQPTKCQAMGLRSHGQGADGYGRKITTDIVAKLDGEDRLRRVYATCISNSASLWVTIRGEVYHLHDCDRVGEYTPHRPLEFCRIDVGTEFRFTSPQEYGGHTGEFIKLDGKRYHRKGYPEFLAYTVPIDTVQVVRIDGVRSPV